MTEDELHLKYLQAETYICEMCGQNILIEYVDDIYQDDSGDYHEECHEEWRDNEARYWAAQYKPDPFKLSASEILDAYEPGSAKRYAMEGELV